jgi:hypothetical protein
MFYNDVTDGKVEVSRKGGGLKPTNGQVKEKA